MGDWDDAAADAETVLGGPSAPLVRTWPQLVRALISLRREGTAVHGEGIDDAWRVFCRFREHYRLFPAAAIAEQAWLTGTADDRLDECRALLDNCPVDGINMAIGDLAIWLRRLDPSVDTNRATGPHRLMLDGAFEAAADEFHRLSMPYEAALALVDSGDADMARRGIDVLDRLGAAAVAAKVRRDLRSSGMTIVPARRRSTTLTNSLPNSMSPGDAMPSAGAASWASCLEDSLPYGVDAKIGSHHRCLGPRFVHSVLPVTQQLSGGRHEQQ